MGLESAREEKNPLADMGTTSGVLGSIERLHDKDRIFEYRYIR